MDMANFGHLPFMPTNHALALLSPINMSPQVPDRFLCICFEKMDKKMREATKKTKTKKTKKDDFQRKVLGLTRCLCVLREYVTEMDKHHLDKRCFPHTWGVGFIVILYNMGI